MSSSLTDLPTLVLSLILEDIYKSSPKTLWSLACVNRACYYITKPLIYRNLSLEISTRQKLLEDCSQLAEHPFCRKFLRHARCLKIQGRMPLLRNETQQPRSAEEYEPNSDAFDAEFGDVFSQDSPDGSADEVRQAWYPLAVLIRDFSHIRDLIWICKNQLPPCLFQELTRHHPSCRMEIRSFRLLSLGESILDPHESELIQSPCLQSISAKATLCDSYGKANYNDDAIFEVVGVAPNLKHVNVVKPRLAAAPNAYQNLVEKKIPPWKGFVPPFKTTGKGALVSLAYPGPSDISVEDIHKWSQHTDLSQLRFFMLGTISDPLVFDSLIQINLTSLTTLDVNLARKKETRDSLLHSAEQCITQLAPLRGLRVEGPLTTTLFDSVLQQHGPTLHRLALICDDGLVVENQLSTISATKIRKIESRCTDLEYLGISVRLARIQASDRWDLCDICPNLPHLRELALNITDRESEELDPSSTESHCKIWTFINEKKKGCALTRLLVYDFMAHAGLIIRRNDMHPNEIDVTVRKFYALESQLVTERFHGLPTARFRDPDVLCSPFETEATDSDDEY